MNIDSLGFADIHCHMLAGVDDGAQTVKEMIQMAQLAKSEGTDVVCFTPHSGLLGTNLDPELLKSTFAEASARLKLLFPHMRFYLGNEIFYGCDAPSKLHEGSYLPLNGSRYVLVEFSPGLDAFNIKSGIKFLKMAGYTPILAHVERYKAVFKKKDVIRDLKRMGAVIQVNSRSVLRHNVFRVGKCDRLLKEGLIDIVASDSHDIAKRPPSMRECYEYISRKFGKRYADRLMKINPRLVLANREIGRKTKTGEAL